MVRHGSVTRRLIDTLQRMEKSSVNCEEYYKRILARESSLLANRSSGTHIPGNNDSDAESLPSLPLSQLGSKEAPKQPHASQLSCGGFGTDDDLPDVNSLIKEITHERKSLGRMNRAIVEDDSDE